MFKKFNHNNSVLIFVSILAVAIWGYILLDSKFSKETPQITQQVHSNIELVLSPTAAPTPTDEEFEDSLWRLVQDWRVKNNYQAYTKSQNMCEIAKIRVKEIQTDWSHDKFQAVRWCENCNLGENLASSYENEAEALSAWEDSPSHLAELSKPYTHSCIEKDGYYITQIFGYY